MNEANRRGVCKPKGFRAAGVAAGIKSSGARDVALVVSDVPAVAAGVFTTNVCQAAPVLVSKEHLQSAATRAVVISSGNANAATGEAGRATSRAMCEAVATELGCAANEVLIAQTGLIGIPLSQTIAVKGVQTAYAELSDANGGVAAEAMMTTDTHAKIAERTITIGGAEVVVAGMAKGAAMLAPSMATMLAVITTDAAAAAPVLQAALRAAMPASFHAFTVDGCRSTNDTVFLLANGAAGAKEISTTEAAEYKVFAAAVAGVCKDLAMQMIGDAEGATKLLTMEVTGARNEEEAVLAPKAVTHSLLCKCSLAGEDAYWGRVLADMGASGAQFEQEQVTISYGGIAVCKNGIAAAHDEAVVAAYMKNKDIHIVADLGAGDASTIAYGCDLTHAYVDENMGTS